MENLYSYLGFIFFIFLTIRLLTHKKRNLPPRPFTLPIIGHLHLIRNPLYQSLAALSSKYGQVLYLKFGVKRVLVICSPSAVEECFTKNDIIFANRPRTMAGEIFTYNYTSFVWAPYGNHWRCLRRLSVVEIFSSNSVQKFTSLREEEVANFLGHLFKISASGTQGVDMKYLFSLLTTNVILRMVAGRRCAEDARDMEEEKRAFQEFKNLFFPSLVTNICDFFPVLRWIGFKGIEKHLREIHRRRDEYIQNLVDEIRLRKTSYSADVLEVKNPSLIEKLLSLQEEDPTFISNEVMIKSMVLMMFIAGTETTATTMEWAMSLLLNHPEALQKVRTEIISHVGDERMLNDSDLSNLPYLRCVLNETLRLYPPAATLLPHCASEDCRVGGFEIPKDTTLIANAWVIHRDPSLWEEPTKFKPERFEGNFEEKEGKYLPFGLGRRACPGATMGMRLVSLALGAAIQCFEWENLGPEKVDMTPGTGMANSKAKPLEALCRPRPDLIKILSQL